MSHRIEEIKVRFLVLKATGWKLTHFEQDIPWLVAEVERLQDQVRGLSEDRDSYRAIAEQRISLNRQLEELLGTDDIAQAVSQIKVLKGEVERLREEKEKLVIKLLDNIWLEAEDE